MTGKQPLNDFDIEATMGRLLRIGVVAAAFVVTCGALLFLLHHGSDLADHHNFSGEPASLTHPVHIVTHAFDWQSDSIIQLGILLLILTPVARIIFAIVGFFLEKDYLYVVIGIIILSIIMTSYFTQISG
jgi:uncharacterized membrane protein